MTRIVVVLAVVWGVASPVAAAASDRPAVSVLAIEAPGVLDAAQAEELADDLAARLVETSKVRVLPREWLPNPPGSEGRQALPSLRAAAREADVEYLLQPIVTSLAARRSPSRASVLARTGRTLLGFRGVRQPPLSCSPPPPPAPLTVELKVIEVESGDVVQTVLATAPAVSTSRSLQVCSGVRPLRDRRDVTVETFKRANDQLARALSLPTRVRRQN